MSDFPSPILSGLSLKLFSWSTENSETVRQAVISEGGVLKIRDFKPPPTLQGISTKYDPCLLPIVHPSKQQQEKQPPTLDELKEIIGVDKTEPQHEFQFLSIGHLHSLYLNHTITPTIIAERIEIILKQSEEGPTPLKLLISHSTEEVFEQAKASTQRYQEGNPLSFLDGIPVVVKDELDMVPYPTTGGTKFIKNIATKDAALVKKLRDMGALLIGKANMHEIGIGVTGINVHHGTPRNPYNINHMTGGSSSGSAASVASGVTVFSIGSDGGGSIRIPASFCGLVGLKATYGRIYGGSGFDSCPSVCHIGPLCSNARDCAAVYASIAGPNDDDNISSHLQPPISLQKFNDIDDLSDLRVGVYQKYFDHADEEVVKSCQAFVDSLASRGAKIVPIEIAFLEESKGAHLICIASEMATAMKQYIPEHLPELSYTTRIPIALTNEFKSSDLVLSSKVRALQIEQLKHIFQQVDVIATPTTARTSPPLSEDALLYDEWNTFDTVKIMRYVALTNLTGNPSISFPSGYSEDGLPIGIQFTSSWWNEDVLLRLANVGDTLVKKRSPATYFSLLSKHKK